MLGAILWYGLGLGTDHKTKVNNDIAALIDRTTGGADFFICDYNKAESFCNVVFKDDTSMKAICIDEGCFWKRDYPGYRVKYRNMK